MLAYQIVRDGNVQVGALLGTVAVVMSIVTALAALGAAIVARAQVSGMKESFALVTDANAELRAAYADQKALADRGERECSERIARLEGQLQALTDGLGQKLAEAIAARLQPALTIVADRIVDGVAQRSADRERKFKEEGTQ